MCSFAYEGDTSHTCVYGCVSFDCMRAASVGDRFAVVATTTTAAPTASTPPTAVYSATTCGSTTANREMEQRAHGTLANREYEKSNSNSRKKWNVKLVFFQPSFVCINFLDSGRAALAHSQTEFCNWEELSWECFVLLCERNSRFLLNS